MNWESEAIKFIEENKSKKRITWKELERATQKSKSTLWRNQKIREKFLLINGRIKRNSHREKDLKIESLKLEIENLEKDNQKLKSLISKLLFIVDERNADAIDVYENILNETSTSLDDN